MLIYLQDPIRGQALEILPMIIRIIGLSWGLSSYEFSSLVTNDETVQKIISLRQNLGIRQVDALLSIKCRCRSDDH